jgi:hypothetical protein
MNVRLWYGYGIASLLLGVFSIFSALVYAISMAQFFIALMLTVIGIFAVCFGIWTLTPLLGKFRKNIYPK